MARKPADIGSSVRARAVTHALRRQVREELPEMAQISDAGLQEKDVEAWAFALAHSSFKSIRDIPPAGNPDTNEARRGDQTDHLRGVTRLAIGIAREMGAAYPELDIDMDVIIAGGLVHDVGKAWEFDPVNRKRWKASQKQSGRPSIRHPAYGAHICLTVGLPEEVAHIAMAHSGEGELLIRSLECMIVHQADYTFWNTLLAGGQLKPETVPPDRRRYVIDRPF
jgi:putative nucleotidyltransferase with HDIG domain